MALLAEPRSRFATNGTVQTFDDGFEVNSRLIDRDRSVLEAITRQHEIDLVDQN